MANLRELLSYSEYAQPWRLYLLPGLLPATLAHTAWIGLVTRLVRHITVPALGGLPAPTPATDGQTHYSGPSSAGGTLEVSSIGLAVFVIWNILSVGVLAPLECVMVRLSTQRPEKQQPLHLAYGARRNAASPARGGAPAPYSHQATAAAQAQPGGAYSDAAPASAPAQPDKPLPAEPPGRASFAIEDDDEAEGEGEGEGGRGGEGASASEASKPLAPVSTSESTPAPAPSAASATPAPAPAASTQPTTEAPHRVLGARAASSDVLPPYTPQAVGPGMGLGYNAEPPEPVIALRPCDEPASSAEAAAAAAEGFGAPTVERYQGLVHCLNTMVEEEGLESLARGAWVTLLGALAGNFL